MLKGIDIRQRVEFIPSTDTEEPKTVFVLRPLSSLEMMEFAHLNEQDTSGALRLYLSKAIVEVKNFVTDDIKVVVDYLDTKTLGELIIEVNKLNNLSGVEIKN